MNESSSPSPPAASAPSTSPITITTTAPTTQPAKPNPPLNRQTSEEANAQQGKRKFSLSQYIERKRLKSNEPQQSALTDTDMRINNVENSKVRISLF